MKFQLDRPIAFIDLETTGLNVERDQIVELSVLKIFPSGNKETYTTRVKPTVPISPEASETHGITIEQLANCPAFKDIASDLFEILHDISAIFGYNIRMFDIPLLYNEFQRSGVNWSNLLKIQIIDVSVIFKRFEPRDLANAHMFYVGRPLSGAHGAEADVIGCYDIFLGQIEKYPELPNDLQSLALFTNYDKVSADVVSNKFIINANGDYIINFGSHKGQKAVDNLSFIQWMTNCNNPPFANDTLEICFKILDQSSAQFKK